MKIRDLLLAALAGLVTSMASAEISYDYAELGFGAIDVDVVLPQNGEGTGPAGFVSYQFYGPFVAFAGTGLIDFEDDNIELSDSQVGLGWTLPMGKNASSFVNVAYLHNDVEPAGQRSFAQDGYGVTLGYRAENHSPWEFIGTVDYVNVESGVEFGGGMSLVYDATRRFSVVGGFSYFDASMSAFLGARFFFDHNH
ncbi:MAG: hypothetical protein KJO54_02525 [Gammaproteobacteria bacterium]|nr:hypothetical protein [Gammaproteobacteria bacterium]NNF61971.1 hypothetical protein [Gammaproteobacteria bacterium]NNM21871.1 hypothetical protein [Gammaproteobacteria bacterium]